MGKPVRCCIAWLAVPEFASNMSCSWLGYTVLPTVPRDLARDTILLLLPKMKTCCIKPLKTRSSVQLHRRQQILLARVFVAPTGRSFRLLIVWSDSPVKNNSTIVCKALCDFNNLATNMYRLNRFSKQVPQILDFCLGPRDILTQGLRFIAKCIESHPWGFQRIATSTAKSRSLNNIDRCCSTVALDSIYSPCK